MSEVKIYVCCHKDYEDVGITNPCYKLISANDIKNDTKLELIKSDNYLDNRLWSELSHIYYIWKHPELHADYIGLNHYRRYFSFMNDIPNLDKPIIPEIITNQFNNYMCYDICHNSQDILALNDIIFNKYKDFYPYFITMLDSHFYVPYNMFLFPKDLFIEYCEFLFGILFELDKKLNINNSYESMIKRIGLKREHYIEKSSNPNNSFNYQARIFGFLAERLSTVFVYYCHKKYGKDFFNAEEIKITEKTYNKI